MRSNDPTPRHRTRNKHRLILKTHTSVKATSLKALNATIYTASSRQRHRHWSASLQLKTATHNHFGRNLWQKGYWLTAKGNCLTGRQRKLVLRADAAAELQAPMSEESQCIRLARVGLLCRKPLSQLPSVELRQRKLCSVVGAAQRTWHLDERVRHRSTHARSASSSSMPELRGIFLFNTFSF